MPSKKFVIIFAVIVILGIGFFVLTKNLTGTPLSSKNSARQEISVAEIGGARLNLLLATTTEAKTRGLSGMFSLPTDEAMLFTFNPPVREGFWMKEMNFPIDIIWIDQENKIVDVWQDALPSSYPKIYFPKANSSYVLETNANFFKNHDLMIGDSVNFF